MSGLITRARRRRYLSATIVAVALTAAAFGVIGALAAGDPVQHGISVSKGCTSPTKIGDPYTCNYIVRNILDEAEDTLTIDNVTDLVHAAPQPGGDVSSGNVLSSLQLVL